MARNAGECCLSSVRQVGMRFKVGEKGYNRNTRVFFFGAVEIKGWWVVKRGNGKTDRWVKSKVGKGYNENERGFWCSRN